MMEDEIWQFTYDTLVEQGVLSNEIDVLHLDTHVIAFDGNRRAATAHRTADGSSL